MKKAVIHQAAERIGIALFLLVCSILAFFIDFKNAVFVRHLIIPCMLYVILLTSKSLHITSEHLTVCCFSIPVRKIPWKYIKRIEFVDRALGRRRAINWPTVIFEFEKCPPISDPRPRQVDKYIKHYRDHLVTHYFTQKKENDYIELLKQYCSCEILTYTAFSKRKP